MMQYKGYIGQVVFDAEAGILHGEVINTRDVITFQATDVEGTKREFERSVDVYLDFCRERGREPEKPFSGKLILRLSPPLHRKAFAAARKSGKSLNTWIAEQVETASS